MSVRAKFRCVETKKSDHGYGSRQNTVVLRPVSGPGNESWAAATPGGEISMNINNPEALDQFKLGAIYFVDFTPAD